MTVRTEARGFDRAADAYERARPEYPPHAVAWLTERLDLRPGRTVVDVAAGTGKLTRALVGTGARVIAVEPLPEMRRLLRQAVPEAEALEGTAEQLPLADGSADAVTVAAAFHWFDIPLALEEIARVLRPGGRLGLVWNIRDSRAPIQHELDELLLPHSRSDWWGRSFDAAAFFPAGPFGPLEAVEFPFEQRFDADGLVERVASISFVALLSDPEARQAPRGGAGARRALRGAVLLPVRLGGVREPPELTEPTYRFAILAGCACPRSWPSLPPSTSTSATAARPPGGSSGRGCTRPAST